MNLRVSVLFVLLVLGITPILNAQVLTQTERLDQAIALLKQDNLDEAWEMLLGLETSQAVLLKGRILLKRGNFNEAYERVLPLVTDPLPALREEAQYTLAVIQFWRRQYAQVLTLTAELRINSRTSAMRREAERLYDQTLHWISPAQAESILATSLSNTIREDILQAQRQTFVEHPISGMIYTLGVVLPNYTRNRDFLPINRNLYAGIQSAIDTHNAQNTNKKIRLSLFRLNEDMSNVSELKAWAETELVDAIIGPLTSAQVRSASQALIETRIPIFAPLANDPSLATASDRIFQVNPGAEQRAKAFADFTYSTLRYRSVAIVSDGSEIAQLEQTAFKDRFTALGGTIEYLFDPLVLRNPARFDKQAMLLSSDPFLIDSLKSKHVDALVLSLGAGESESLFNLVITALDAVGSRVSILGTQDLNIIRIPSRVKRDYNVYTYSPYDENPFGTQVVEFDSNYRVFTNQAPDMYGYLGFDIARYIARLSDKYPNPSLWLQSIKEEPTYRGLVVPIAFDEDRVNRRVYFYKLTDPDKIQMGTE
jgi:ABC-type branched-subunit amino acid transport system substrate-binding protein